jgi:glycosyltransferase involved in cell wall biosynthesis
MIGLWRERTPGIEEIWMRVLFLAATPSTGYAAQWHRLKKLCEGLDALGIETSLLSFRDMPIDRPLLLFPLNLPFVWPRIQDFDFIHAISYSAYAAVLWKLVNRIPVVYDVDADALAEACMHWQAHGSLRTAFWIFQAVIMNQIVLRSKDYFITVSRPLQERLVNQKGVSRGRIHIVRNGVDTQMFRPAFGGADGVFTVCYAGGFQVWQGIDNLVAAGQYLKGEPIRIKIVGFGQRDMALKARIAASLGDMVELVNRVPQSELVPHLSEAHFLIIPRLPHPAVEIAFPTKFSEYLSMGKPVIVSDVDETASFVREYRCGLVSDPTPEALAETIRQAATLTHSELVKMGQNGRHLAETVFDWEVVCRNYAGLLHQWRGEVG